MPREDVTALELMRLAASGASEAETAAAERPADPDPALPVQVANAREQQLLLAYRRIRDSQVARVVVEVVDTVAARRSAD